jgi:hypothetical protein
VFILGDFDFVRAVYLLILSLLGDITYFSGSSTTPEQKPNHEEFTNPKNCRNSKSEIQGKNNSHKIM